MTTTITSRDLARIARAIALIEAAERHLSFLSDGHVLIACAIDDLADITVTLRTVAAQPGGEEQ